MNGLDSINRFAFDDSCEIKNVKNELTVDKSNIEIGTIVVLKNNKTVEIKMTNEEISKIIGPSNIDYAGLEAGKEDNGRYIMFGVEDIQSIKDNQPAITR